jgi:hypothetical protein
VRCGKDAENFQPAIAGFVITGVEAGVSQTRRSDIGRIPMFPHETLGIAEQKPVFRRRMTAAAISVSN